MTPAPVHALRALSFRAPVMALAVLWFAAALPALAAAPTAATPLLADPAIHMGQLPNGMRYWIRPNPTPPGKAYIWLRINSGSLNEEDQQQGLAHLLEHMAFRGSEHFPGNAIIKRFEEIGMSMGRHQNAFTGFTETVYTLSLPDNGADTLDLALLALSNIASRMTIDPQAVEQEKRVVLEESRVRKGVSDRILNRMIPLIIPDSRTALRMPIGKEDSIRNAGADDLRDYYRTWYRPDNAVLLVAGDINATQLEGAIARHFGPWKSLVEARSNARDEIKPYIKARAAVLTDPELTDSDVLFANLKSQTEKTTVDDLRRQLVSDLGPAMVNRRLMRLINTGQVPFTMASIEAMTFSRDMLAVLGQASGKPEDWKAMLTSLVTEIDRAQVHGFRENELDDQRRDVLAGLERDIVIEPTRQSLAIISAMNSDLETSSTPITSVRRLAIYRELFKDIGVAEVAEVFRRDFSPENRLYLVTLPDRKSQPIPTESEILAVARTAASAAVVVAPAPPGAFLERDPAPGKIVHQREDTESRVVSARLANGVRLNVRHMDEQKDKVQIIVSLTGGALRETAQNRGIDNAAHLALLFPSTDTHTMDDIDDMLIGRSIFVIGYGFHGKTRVDISSSPADLEDALRLTHLLLTRARIDKERFRIWREETLQGIERRQYSTKSQLGIRLNQLYSNGDPRFMPLQPADIGRMTIEASQAWLDRLLRTAPMEVAIVGDIPAERALALGAKYFGSLPPRPDTDPGLEPLRKIAIKPGALEASVSVMTETPRAEVYVGWRGADLRNVPHQQALSMAASILSRRLFDEVRSQRGHVYGIGCYSNTADVYPGLGRFGVSFSTDPDKATEVADLVLRLVEKFAAEGPTAEELDIARKQWFVVLDERRRDPYAWGNHLSSLRYFGSRELLTEREREPINRLTARDLRTVVRQYIVPARSIRVVSLPVKPETATVAGQAPAPGNTP